MKKEYFKPEIIFENFAASTNIALNCEGIVGLPSKGECTVIGTGGIAMFDGNLTDLCDFVPQQNDKWNSYCYHVPTEYNNLFNS